MQKLMITTAIVAVTSFGALAQTGDMAPGGATPGMDQSMDQAAVPETPADMTAQERTAERILSANVYGAEGDTIANVDNLVFDDDAAISHVVMDVGGFLGLGSHSVALALNEVDITWNDEDGNVRVQVSMTQEQLEEHPEFEG
jgi:hypothetical protein